MSNTPQAPEALAAYVDATAALIGLPLSEAHRPGVLRYFALAAEMAALVNGLPLTTHDEPAGAFTPIAPDDLPDATPVGDKEPAR